MRVATFVLGIALAVAGGTSEASESAPGSARTYSPASFGEGRFAAPASDRFVTRGSTAWLNAQEARNGAMGVMGFVPSQSPGSFGRLPGGDFVTLPTRPYNPANTPLPKTRTVEDHLLTGFVALMLIAYQLRRKHRFLRPHQFST